MKQILRDKSLRMTVGRSPIMRVSPPQEPSSFLSCVLNVVLNCLGFCFTKSRCSLHFVVVCLTFCSFVSALPLRTTQNPLVSASFEHDIYKILSNRFFGLFKTSEWRLKCFSVILSGFSVEWSRAKRANSQVRDFRRTTRRSLKVKSRKSTARKSKTAKQSIFLKKIFVGSRPNLQL